jgi:predicted outer membrane protein
MKTTNLLKLAISQTEKNVSRKSVNKNTNEYLVEILFDKKQTLTKTEVISEIALDRLIKKSKVEINETNFLTDEIQKLYKSELITANNGFDTATCNGHTNSNFNYNELYFNYKLVKNNGLYSITLK